MSLTGSRIFHLRSHAGGIDEPVVLWVIGNDRWSQPLVKLDRRLRRLRRLTLCGLLVHRALRFGDWGVGHGQTFVGDEIAVFPEDISALCVQQSTDRVDKLADRIGLVNNLLHAGRKCAFKQLFGHKA